MRVLRALLLGGGIACAAAVLFVGLARCDAPPIHVVAGPAALERAEAVRLQADRPRAASSVASTAAQAVPELPELIRKFAAIDDGRAFALSAWAKPAEGGRFYASRVADHCAFVRNFTSSLVQSQPEVAVVGSEHYLAASDALRKLQARCGQFTDDELTALGSRGLLKGVESDRLLDRVKQFNESAQTADPGKYAQVVKNVVATRDPLVLEELGQRLLLPHDRSGSFYFDGERIPTKSTDSPVLAAALLLPCAFGYPCGDNDPTLLVECASGAGCYPSRFDKVKATLANGDEARMQKILAAYDRLVAAIRNGDSGKFIPQ